jgi:hypothetical protein
MTKNPRTDKSRSDAAKSQESAQEVQAAPAGNAIYDPSQQTQRLDMPAEEQKTAGEPARGTAPPRPEDLPVDRARKEARSRDRDDTGKKV